MNGLDIHFTWDMRNAYKRLVKTKKGKRKLERNKRR